MSYIEPTQPAATPPPASGPAPTPPGYPAVRASFNIGDTLQDVFNAVFKNFGVFLVLALILYGAPTLLTSLLTQFYVSGATGGLDIGGLGAIQSLVGLIGLIANVVLEGALARAVFDHLNGRRPTAGSALRGALDTFLPLLGIAILSTLGLILGFILLVVPGLILMTMWAVTAPAQVVERKGVFASFSRSVALTEGHRWAVFFMLVITGIITLVIGAIGDALGGLVGAGTTMAAGAAASVPVIAVGGVIKALAGSVGSIFTGAAGAAIYYELRRAKEGLAATDLASVFD